MNFAFWFYRALAVMMFALCVYSYIVDDEIRIGIYFGICLGALALSRIVRLENADASKR